jgi:CelD/BcsL family acetyltransferase involved in cellulose biosynthesis
MLEQSHKLKHREFDFSVGAEDYKMMYATHVRILGPVGRPALGQRMRSWAKEEVKRQVPNLFRMVQGLKKQMHEQNDPKAFGLLLG